MDPTQESRLGDARHRDRSKVRHELGIMRSHSRDDHRIRTPDQRPPVGLLPQPEVLLRHQLVADHPARYQPETGFVAGVDQLLRGRGMEVRDRLGRQDQRASPGLRNGERPVDGARGRDRIVRTRRETLTAPDAVLLDDLDDGRLRRQRNRIGRAHTDACQTSDTARRVDGQMQGCSGCRENAPVARWCKLGVTLRSVKRWCRPKVYRIVT